MTALRAVRSTLVVAALLAVVLLVSVLTTGPLTLTTTSLAVAGTVVTPGVHVDALSGTLLVVVTGIGALVAAFSVRHLVGGSRLERYALLQAAMVAGLAWSVTAASLPFALAGWVVAGLALAGLVGHTDSGRAARAAHQVRARLLAGDSLVAAGIVVAGASLASLDRVDLAGAVDAASGPWLSIGAVLVVLGAAVRSALVPFHRWLPETAEAPTPVSALLHAGMVNGVGIIGVLAWPLLASAWPALVLLVAVGALSAVVGTLLGRARPDAKGRLASSTTAQMGYLGIQLGLGVPAAALFHLIGHALYKATLFLGVGEAVQQSRRPNPRAPGARVLVLSIAATSMVTAGLAAGLLALWPDADKGVAGVVPLTLAAVVAGLASARVVADPTVPRRSRALGVSVVVGALTAFLVAIVAWTAAFAPSFAAPAVLSEAAAAGLVGAMAVIAAAGLVVDRALRRGRLRRLAVRLALQAGPLPQRRRHLGYVVTGEPRRPSSADVARTQTLVQLAGDSVGPTWPLTSYVAANPVAGLERLPYSEALATASGTWGDRRDIGDDVFRRYHAAGRITDEQLDAAIGDRPDRPLVRRLLLSDPHEAAGMTAAAAVAVDALPLESLPAVHSTSWTGQTAVEALDQVLDRDLTSTVDAQASLWSAIVHTRSAPWSTAEGSLYATWRQAMTTGAADAHLGVHGAGRLAASLPERPDVAVALLLDRLDVPHRQRLGYLSRTLARAPGWAAHQVWRAGRGGTDLAELLAVRLGLEVMVVEAVTTAALGHPGRWPDLVSLADDSSDWTPSGDPLLDAHRRRQAATLLAQGAHALGWDEADLAEATRGELQAVLATAASLPPAARVETWQAALERGYTDRLLDELRPRAAGAAPARPRNVRAQVVTCIDVRSERLRRHLEEADDVETLGFAGFFGVPFSLVDADGVTTAQCPVLVTPSNSVRSARAPGSSAAAARDTTAAAFRAAQEAPLLPLVLAEASGWGVGLAAAVRTAMPRIADSYASRLDPGPGRLTIDGADGLGFSLAERVYLAEAALRAMGLVDHHAPLIVLLGHAGHVANNPFAAGYDCGACGGNGGLANARVAAAILNDPEVRRGLRDRGIDLPDATVVVPGLHDTTRDRVALLPEVTLTDGQRALLASVERDLDRASAATAAERARRLPGLTRPSHDVPTHRPVDGAPADGRVQEHLRRTLDARAGDWAETRPEWGLAGNAALIIGPRELTRGLNLDGRTFLHSYRPEADPGSAALEVILTAPLVVAQWINSGYTFATLDPERFGAGDKILQNPVGGIGVLTGSHGDLRVGLPLQSVSAGTADPAGLPAHEPLRLSVVVAASRHDVSEIIDRQPSVRRLLSGRWIKLFVLESGSSTVWQWTDDGWTEAHSAPQPTAPGTVDMDVTAEVSA